jgi:hypothetical protein
MVFYKANEKNTLVEPFFNCLFTFTMECGAFSNNAMSSVIKTVMKYHLKKIDTSFHQPLPNMVQRLFADVINDAIWFMNIPRSGLN